MLPVYLGKLGEINMNRYYLWSLWRERAIRNAIIILPLALFALAVAVLVAG